MNVRRALIVNFNGLGNGLILLPILKHLEDVEKNFYYFHVHNAIFKIQEFVEGLKLNNLLGLVPSHWRQFNPTDWDVIKEFIQQNQIDLIINLRNEDQSLDPRYSQFKQEITSSHLEFWDLDEVTEKHQSNQHIVYDILNLFYKYGLDLSGFNRHWLRDYYAVTNNQELKHRKIGFFTAASQSVKRWSASNWIELGATLLDSTDYTVDIYAGREDEELKLATNVATQLRNKFSYERCSLIIDKTLPQLAIQFNALELLISNDSVSIHLAAALDIPTVGLYFSTDAEIWGGFSDKFIPVQSQFGLQCPAMKKTIGNCIYYYGGCPAPCKNEVTTQRVLDTVRNVFSISQQFDY